MKNRVLRSSFLIFMGLFLILVAAPAFAAGQSWRDAVTGIEFVRVPGGCFQMGSSVAEKGRDDDEGPVHKVCVSEFWIGKYEVTVGQWRRFIKETGYKTDAERDAGGHKGSHVLYTKANGKGAVGWRDGRDWENPGFAQQDNYPVCCVSYNDVEKFVNWLNRKSSGSFRLPTEAEWEFACRVGTTTASYWGDDMSHSCRYANVGDQSAKREWSNLRVHDCDDGFKASAPVGSFLPNNFALYDMQGNVCEWCSDWFDRSYYKKSPLQNPQGPGSGTYRVIRGGGWRDLPKGVRSANRSRFRPSIRNNRLGFRLASSGRR